MRLSSPEAPVLVLQAVITGGQRRPRLRGRLRRRDGLERGPGLTSVQKLLLEVDGGLGSGQAEEAEQQRHG